MSYDFSSWQKLTTDFDCYCCWLTANTRRTCFAAPSPDQSDASWLCGRRCAPPTPKCCNLWAQSRSWREFQWIYSRELRQVEFYQVAFSSIVFFSLRFLCYQNLAFAVLKIYPLSQCWAESSFSWSKWPYLFVVVFPARSFLLDPPTTTRPPLALSPRHRLASAKVWLHLPRWAAAISSLMARQLAVMSVWHACTQRIM